MQDKKQSGRPLKIPWQDFAMDNYNSRITAWHARMARKFGEGNLSAGIRRAIEEMVLRNSEKKE